MSKMGAKKVSHSKTSTCSLPSRLFAVVENRTKDYLDHLQLAHMKRVDDYGNVSLQGRGVSIPESPN